MHTKEPWAIEKNRPYIIQPNYPSFNWIASVQTSNNENWEADARRIVACVNACAGVPIEVLEMTGATMVPPEEPYSLVKQQRDELLAALRELTIRAENEIADTCDVPEIVNANAVLAKADLHNDVS